MSDVKELLKGGYDLNVHSAPDCLPRKMDDIDMAERITASTLSGYAIKNHWTSTAGRAKLINQQRGRWSQPHGGGDGGPRRRQARVVPHLR